MKNNWKKIFIVSIFVGGVLSLFASSSPDGLEKVAIMQGFLQQEKHLIPGLFPDYQVSFIGNETVAGSLAGIIGTLFVFFLLFSIGKILYQSALIGDEQKSVRVRG